MLNTVLSAGRSTRRGLQIGLLAIAAPLAAVLLMTEPRLAVAVLGAGFLFVALDAPVAAVGLFLFAHVATPAYVRVPIPGGIYAPPISTTLLLALIGVGLLAFLGRARLPEPPAEGGRRLIGAFALFAAIALLSLIDPRTQDEGPAMWAKIFALPATALAAVVCACRSPQQVERLSLWLVFGGVAASAYAVVEYGLGRNPLLELYRSEVDVRYFTSDVLGHLAYRCFSVYGNPLEFGMVMGMIFPFAAVRTATADSAGQKLAYGLLSATIALGVALTFSRGPMLALLLGCVIIGLIYRQLRPWLVGSALLAAGVLVLSWPFIGAGVTDRINDIDNMTLRFKLWETAFAVFSDHPLRGVGIGNFPQYYLEAARQNHIGPFYEFGADAVENIRVAENAYLQLAAETGVIGFAAGVGAVLTMLFLAIRLARHAGEPRTRHLATAIALSIVIYSVNGMFVTAYTLYFATLLFTGFLPGCLIVLDRADGGTVGGALPGPERR